MSEKLLVAIVILAALACVLVDGYDRQVYQPSIRVPVMMEARK